MLAEDLRRALEACGATVVGPVGDLEQALDQAKRDGFDFAALDVKLRGRKAYCVADELRRKDIPFVFTTGYCQSAIPERFSDVPRWEKPFSIEALIKDIEALCRAGDNCPR